MSYLFIAFSDTNGYGGMKPLDFYGDPFLGLTTALYSKPVLVACMMFLRGLHPAMRSSKNPFLLLFGVDGGSGYV